MRLSKQDPNDSSKRRHFEISIDSPFHILSCQATHANTTLPAYNSPLPSSTASGCGCPDSKRLSSAASQRGSQISLRTNLSNPSTTSTTPTSHPWTNAVFGVDHLRGAVLLFGAHGTDRGGACSDSRQGERRGQRAEEAPRRRGQGHHRGGDGAEVSHHLLACRVQDSRDH